jgi:anti-sigma B factor antagonist
MADQMQCRVSAAINGHLVEVFGEVDMATAPKLKDVLVQFANGDVTVVLTGVTLIDSSGLHAIVAAQRHIEQRRNRLTVQAVPPRIRRLFEIAGLDALLRTDPISDERPGLESK